MKVSEVEEKIGIPWTSWAGNCKGIADAMVEHMDINGKAVYGLWVGNIDPDSMFAGRAVTHHGWIRCKDGKIIDPTRWVFECNRPYIYIGESDYYDEGGITLKLNRSPPDYDPNKHIDYDFGEEWYIYKTLLKSDKVSLMQLYYLANLPPQAIGIHARKMYEHIRNTDNVGFIPIDYWDLCDIVEN